MANGAGAGEAALIVVDVELDGHAPLAQSSLALGVVGRAAHFANRGDHDAGKNADDRDHREQFDEREGGGAGAWGFMMGK